jgi:hypothetical protein
LSIHWCKSFAGSSHNFLVLISIQNKQYLVLKLDKKNQWLEHLSNIAFLLRHSTFESIFFNVFDLQWIVNIFMYPKIDTSFLKEYWNIFSKDTLFDTLSLLRIHLTHICPKALRFWLTSFVFYHYNLKKIFKFIFWSLFYWKMISRYYFPRFWDFQKDFPEYLMFYFYNYRDFGPGLDSWFVGLIIFFRNLEFIRDFSGLLWFFIFSSSFIRVHNL